MKRLSLGFLIGCGALFGQSCANYKELLNTGYMNIGVKIDTTNPAVVKAATAALNYWSGVLDMSWHVDITDGCAVEFQPHQWLPTSRSMAGSVGSLQEIGGARLPWKPLFDGVIFFLYPRINYDLKNCFKHEIGHLLGLEHDPDIESLMYPNSEKGGSELIDYDLRQLGNRHLLRKDARDHTVAFRNSGAGKRQAT